MFMISTYDISGIQWHYSKKNVRIKSSFNKNAVKTVQNCQNLFENWKMKKEQQQLNEIHSIKTVNSKAKLHFYKLCLMEKLTIFNVFWDERYLIGSVSKFNYQNKLLLKGCRRLPRLKCMRRTIQMTKHTEYWVKTVKNHMQDNRIDNSLPTYYLLLIHPVTEDLHHPHAFFTQIWEKAW